jgi:putative acetyltransferase
MGDAHRQLCPACACLISLSLETGAMDYFAPAHSLYGRFGFARCAPFASYAEDPNSVFMTRELD